MEEEVVEEVEEVEVVVVEVVEAVAETVVARGEGGGRQRTRAAARSSSPP